jgi:N-acetyl-alpha-D-muramate 1-phosphate uridylyltransferase
MKVMLFAAGLGTRLRPLTDTMPKAMVPVAGRPLIDIVLRHLIAQGATEVVVNVHHFAQQIVDFVKQHEWPVPVRISDETDELLNTGGGLRHAAPLFAQDGAPILIHNVDILSNAPIAAFYKQNLQADSTQMVSQRDTQRYLLFDDDMRLRGWTNIATGEVKSPFDHIEVDKLQRYAFSGIHMFSPRLFDLMAGRPASSACKRQLSAHCSICRHYE